MSLDGSTRSSSWLSEAVYSVRAVSFDYYMSKPTVQFDHVCSPLTGCALQRVPVIRVYGPNPNGKSICLHLHKIYPYFFVDIHDIILTYHHTLVKEYIGQFAKSLERAIEESEKNRLAQMQSVSAHSHRHSKPENQKAAVGEEKNNETEVRKDHTLEKGVKSAHAQYLFDISLSKAVPFYGYHDEARLFLRVSLLDPRLAGVAVALLRNGACMATPFKVYEGHIDYFMKMMVDYRIYGMDWIHLRQADVRTGSGSRVRLRHSSCFLELDATPEAILNRVQGPDNLPSPPQSSEEGWEDTLADSRKTSSRAIKNNKEFTLVPSLRALWDEERARRRAAGLDPTPTPPATVTRGTPAYDEHTQILFRQLHDLVLADAAHPWPRPTLSSSKVRNQKKEESDTASMAFSSPIRHGQEVCENKSTGEETSSIFLYPRSAPCPPPHARKGRGNHNADGSKGKLNPNNEREEKSSLPPQVNVSQLLASASCANVDLSSLLSSVSFHPPVAALEKESETGSRMRDSSEHYLSEPFQEEPHSLMNTQQLEIEVQAILEEMYGGQDEEIASSQILTQVTSGFLEEDMASTDEELASFYSSEEENVSQIAPETKPEKCEKMVLNPERLAPDAVWERKAAEKSKDQEWIAERNAISHLSASFLPLNSPTAAGPADATGTRKGRATPRHTHSRSNRVREIERFSQLVDADEFPTRAQFQSRTAGFPLASNASKRADSLPGLQRKPTSSSPENRRAPRKSTPERIPSLPVSRRVLKKSEKIHSTPQSQDRLNGVAPVETRDPFSDDVEKVNSPSSPSSPADHPSVSPIAVKADDIHPIPWPAQTPPHAPSVMAMPKQCEEKKLSRLLGTQSPSYSDWKRVRAKSASSGKEDWSQLLPSPASFVGVEPSGKGETSRHQRISSVSSVMMKGQAQWRSPSTLPPTRAVLAASWQEYQLEATVAKKPYFSRKTDQPEKPVRHHLRVFRTPVKGTLSHLPWFGPPLPLNSIVRRMPSSLMDGRVQSVPSSFRWLTPALPPPSLSFLAPSTAGVSSLRKKKDTKGRYQRPNGLPLLFASEFQEKEGKVQRWIKKMVEEEKVINQEYPQLAMGPLYRKGGAGLQVPKNLRPLATKKRSRNPRASKTRSTTTRHRSPTWSKKSTNMQLQVNALHPQKKKRMAQVTLLKSRENLTTHPCHVEDVSTKKMGVSWGQKSACEGKNSSLLREESVFPLNPENKSPSFFRSVQSKSLPSVAAAAAATTTTTKSSGSGVTPTLDGKSLASSVSCSSRSTQNHGILSVEVHAQGRGALLSDPQVDAIKAVYCAFQGAIFSEEPPELVLFTVVGVEEEEPSSLGSKFVLSSGEGMGAATTAKRSRLSALQVSRYVTYPNEHLLLQGLVLYVREKDPDFLVGYELSKNSLGWLVERADCLGFPLAVELSRLQVGAPRASKPVRRPGRGDMPYIPGRILLNVWYLMRHEMSLRTYTLENVCAHVLGWREVHLSPTALRALFRQSRTRWRGDRYYLRRTALSLLILQRIDFIGKSAELARVYGIDFASVLSRGSQYRVESVLLRLTKCFNYLLYSPSRVEVANQRSAECLPMVMEPHSDFYASPVLVLDFQSLYPTMMIAYNLCFSTCFGRAAYYREEPSAASRQEEIAGNGVTRRHFPLGVTHLSVERGALAQAGTSRLFMAPNEVIFAQRALRTGILPRMLDELLRTRIMVKKAMKNCGDDVALHRMLNARQLALKLLCNVTYGYAGASFSGRMPCIELADAIVQSGRETLLRAMQLVESNTKWNAKVVYGDTDSLFVHLPGRSKSEAFQIGKEIAAAVTQENPPPVRLEFEKVYYPCFLVSKKRYVGFAYENEFQKEPKFDAKGIETVRRDNCPAVSGIMERSLRNFFADPDLSQLKRYLQHQWKLIHCGRINLKDFIFANEVKSKYRSVSAMPPSALISAKRAALDPRAAALPRERVPYVVVCGSPGARLKDVVVSPEQLLEPAYGLRLNCQYYICSQIIPALARLFDLVGANLKAWYIEMPRFTMAHLRRRPQMNTRNELSLVAGESRKQEEVQKQRPKTIVQYYASRSCVNCGALCGRHSALLCPRCVAQVPQTAIRMLSVAKETQQALAQIRVVCRNCSFSQSTPIICDSIDCAIYFERCKLTENLAVLSQTLQHLDLC